MESFTNFLEDMGVKPSPQHSIERENNDGNYDPGNCRWALPCEQNVNKRSNIRITRDGVTLIATEWARRLGLCPKLVLHRIRKGWNPVRAISSPKGKFTKPTPCPN
jgi:hypothetical protein